MFGDIQSEKSLQKSREAPGPPGWILLGNLLEFRRDVLKLALDSRRDYGDVVRFRLGPSLIHLLAHPDHFKHVLITNQHNYNKATRSALNIKSVTGEGLLTSIGDDWLRQRRLMQPAFGAQRLAGFTELMAQATKEMVERWRPFAASAQPIDVASEMMRLTFTIVGKCLFGADVRGDLETVESAAAAVLEHTYHRLETLVDPPDWIPTPRQRRFRRALATLDKVVYRIINEQRTETGPPRDLLSLLLRQRDPETGSGMSDQQVRNETITLLLAGHETTANALTWTWHVLAQHPEVEERLRGQSADVLGTRPPTTEDLPKLNYASMVVRESMRLYPPIWIMERRVLADDVVSGYRIPAGSTVVLCPYVTHRHPDFWKDPERFDPERFLPEECAARPACAYVPFGAGQRLCIGNNFAMMEAQIILTLVLQSYRLKAVPGFPVVPKPGITLRTKHGLHMTVEEVKSSRH
jgi:cytochrome P450